METYLFQPGSSNFKVSLLFPSCSSTCQWSSASFPIQMGPHFEMPNLSGQIVLEDAWTILNLQVLIEFQSPSHSICTEVVFFIFHLHVLLKHQDSHDATFFRTQNLKMDARRLQGAMKSQIGDVGHWNLAVYIGASNLWEGCFWNGLNIVEGWKKWTKTNRYAIFGPGAVSSQTVCQMPETRVYQIPWGDFDCLPRGWKLPVASITCTTKWFRFSTTASEISNLEIVQT